MTLEVFGEFLSALVANAAGALFVLILIDEWRFSLRVTWVVVCTVLAAIWLTFLMAFLYLPVHAANFLAGVLDLFSLVLALIISPWRRGRLLFVLLCAYNTVFMCIFLSSIFARLAWGAHLAVRVVSSLLFLIWLWRCFRPALHSVLRTQVEMWYRCSLIPLLTGLLCFFSMLTRYAGGLDSLSVGASMDTALFLVFMGVCIPLCLYVAFFQFFRVLDRQFRAQRDAAVLSTQLTAAQQLLTEEHRSQARDQAHHEGLILLLDHLDRQIDAGDFTGAQSGLHELSTRISALGAGSFRAYTGEPVVDAVLSSYVARALEEGIEFRVDLRLPRVPALEPMGLAITLTNALENSFAAVLRAAPGVPRQVLLSGSGTELQFCLELKNTYSGVVVFDPVTLCPVSRQPGHGFGTRSIAAFAAKHGGTFSFDADGAFFRLRLLI